VRRSTPLRRFTAAAAVVHSGQVKVAHILMDPADASRLDELYAQIVGETATLAELAALNSVCPSKANGGEIGWVSRGQTVGAFEDVAFTTPVGAVAKAATNFGVHIIQVLEVRELPPAPINVSVADLQEVLEAGYRFRS
jgi:peptidyl-prolyl cis-trans isomerase C